MSDERSSCFLGLSDFLPANSFASSSSSSLLNNRATSGEKSTLEAGLDGRGLMSACCGYVLRTGEAGEACTNVGDVLGCSVKGGWRCSTALLSIWAAAVDEEGLGRPAVEGGTSTCGTVASGAAAA